MPPDERDRLEQIARYALRPPVAHERLAWTNDEQVRLELRRPWSDGTTHLLFDPVELLERLAALTPRPRVNLILYHGVLGARAARRSAVVRYGATDRASPAPDAAAADDAPAEADPHAGRNYLWADLMRRSLGLDVTACPRCGGRLRLIALIDDPARLALSAPSAYPTYASTRASNLDIDLQSGHSRPELFRRAVLRP